MKKILFYINTLERGGAERVISNLANQYAASGSKVYFATSNGADNEYPLEKEILRFNLMQNYISNKILKNIYLVRKLRKIINDKKPDIVISFLKSNSKFENVPKF